MSVALDVGAPVMVAALGNRNEIVKVFDAAFVRLALEQLMELHPRA